MDFFQDLEKVYSSRTKEYFREVLSSYAIGNYRSAIVMLYSVCLCDLVYKLQELKDLYDDKIAKNILEEVEKEQKDSNSKSSWEKTLVDQTYHKTNLLDHDGYVYISQMFSIRNLSAHPALDQEGELISPPKEVVATYIRTSLDKILLKSPIFSKDIIHFITEDLAENKELLMGDNRFFARYVKRKYLERMTDSIYQKTFRVFWRFTFKSTNQDCVNNRDVNFRFITRMILERQELIVNELKSNTEKYEVGNTSSEIGYAIVFLAFNPVVYKCLPEHTQVHIRTSSDKKPKYKLLSTFLSASKKDHLNQLRNNNQYIAVGDVAALNYMYKLYEEDGLANDCLDYFIDVVERSTTYVDAGKRIELYVNPFLKRMQMYHYERLFKLFEEFQQIKNNIYKSAYAQNIWDNIKQYFPADYDKSRYPMFFANLTELDND